MSDFETELVEIFTAANIPLNKLTNTKVREFLIKYTKMQLKDESYYRKKVIELLYIKKREDLLKFFSTKDFYIVVDELKDEAERKMLKILVGECSIDQYCTPKLLKTIDLKSCNSDSISKEVIDLLIENFGGTISSNHFDAIMSDGASYCIRMGKILQTIFPEVIHITCVCHGLHRISEKIRNKCGIMVFIGA
jgi:hypothetical protein